MDYKMKIVVIGLGSMGKRRIRLLKQYFPFVCISGVDNNPERTGYCQDIYEITTYSTLESAVEAETFNCAFVCTSPLSHSAVIQQCLNKGINVFSEINLVTDGYFENMKLAEERRVKLFLSSTMIYRNEMKYLYQELKDASGPVSYDYHVGQYLPDWHPWEHYKDFFVGDKRTNGCREILAIELPWIIRVFGPIQNIKVVRCRLTKLSINYDDCYMMILSHENGTTGVFVVDIVAREAIRNLKIVGEEIFITWNGTPDSFIRKNMQDNCMEKVELYSDIQREWGYNKTIVENQYVNEMRQFFGELEGSSSGIYGFKEDLETLKIIDRIEEE